MPKFAIKRVAVGMLGTNCCLIKNQETGEVVVLDPGDEADKILAQVEKMGGKVVAILLTHGHYDHTLAIEGLLRAVGKVPVVASEKERPMFEDDALNCTAYGEPSVFMPDVWVREGDVLPYAGARLRVLLTPGHTAGSVCYYMEETGVLFAGDTLFCRSYGRTDLPTGDEKAIWESLRRLLTTLPEETLVIPGHGMNTTIRYERKVKGLV